MSMLGEQIKELREEADILDGLEGMDNLVTMLREAADTIESLRDKFVLQNENGILYGREQIEALEAKWKAENDALRDYRAFQTTWSDSGLDGIEERYADEIRELMGVSE